MTDTLAAPPSPQPPAPPPNALSTIPGADPTSVPDSSVTANNAAVGGPLGMAALGALGSAAGHVNANSPATASANPASTDTVDYDALAKESGAISSQPPKQSQNQSTGSIDYDALAKESGAISSQPPKTSTYTPDIIDRMIAGHPTAVAFNRSLEEGVLSAFGLKPPDPNDPHSITLSDVVDQSIHNITDAAKHSFAAWGGNTPADAYGGAGILAKGVAAAMTVPDMMATGIEGMATTLEDGGKELIEGITQKDPQKTGHGVGKLMGTLGQIFSGQESGEGIGKVIEKTGEAAEDVAPSAGNSLLRATNPKNFLYGRNPGRAFIDEKITPPLNLTLQGQLENLQDQFSVATDNLDNQVRTKLQDATVAGKALDPASTIKQTIQDAKNNLANQQGLANRQQMISDLDSLKTELLSKYDSQGKVIGTIDGKTLTPIEVNELKKGVGKSTEWVSSLDPEFARKNFVNGIKRQVYGQLSDMVDQAAPGTKDLNARYSNAIEVEGLLKKRLLKEGTNELGMQRLLARGEWLSALGGLISGHPLVAATAALDRAYRSTAGRVVRGRVLNAAGNAAQEGGATAGSAAGGAGAAATAVGAESNYDHDYHWDANGQLVHTPAPQ